MKRTVLGIIAGVGLLALVPTAALAHTDVSIGIGIPGPVYAEPAPAYYGAAPVYAPTPVYYGGYHDDGWYRWHHREWEHRRWEEQRWHEEHGWHGDHDGWRR
jgi:hypothetical protein